MHNGRVVNIFIARTRGEPMMAVSGTRAVARQGLEGDRYFCQAGTWSRRRGSGTEVTLMDLEVLDVLRHDYGIVLDPSNTRRNIITREISVNDLVGREFWVGEVILRGIDLCEPCAHLERATQKGVLRSLAHRGGLRAQILVSGTIRVGDFIADRARRQHEQNTVSYIRPAARKPRSDMKGGN